MRGRLWGAPGLVTGDSSGRGSCTSRAPLGILFNPENQMRNYSRGISAGLLVALVWMGVPRNSQSQLYSITELGTLGGRTSTGYGINSSGQVTGVAITAGGTAHAFAYSPAHGMTDLGTLGGATSAGYAINSSGQVTGVAMTADGTSRAFYIPPAKA